MPEINSFSTYVLIYIMSGILFRMIFYNIEADTFNIAESIQRIAFKSPATLFILPTVVWPIQLLLLTCMALNYGIFRFLAWIV